jgi:hypothetical protein
MSPPSSGSKNKANKKLAHGLFFDPEDGSDKFLCMALHSITTVVRTADTTKQTNSCYRVAKLKL